MRVKRIVIISSIVATLVLVLLFAGLVMTKSMFTKLSGDMSSKEMQYFPGRADSIAPPRGTTNQESARVNTGGAMPPPVAMDSAYRQMYFEDYGTNVFLNPAQDPLSTFGLDVDTASYSIAKNYIMRGELPPTDAIRPEEFINYFEYDYPEPEDTFSITTYLAPSPFDPSLHYLLIGLRAEKPVERKPAILTFVVDVSGSMNQENRLGLVKRSLKYLVDNLQEGDRIAIIAYSTQATLMISHTPAEYKQIMYDSIDRLGAQGSTNAEAGLRRGYLEARKGYQAGANNRVILISDGVANTGATTPDAILSVIDEYKEQGIELSAIGVGMGNFNDVLLEQIADKADGNYAYINDFNEAERIFSEQLEGTLITIAKDARVQIRFNPSAVKRYRLIGYENRAMEDSQFRNDSADAGEVGAGHEVTAIYEVELRMESSMPPGTVFLRYEDAEGGAIREQTQDIMPSYSEFSLAPDRYRLAIIAARFAQILKHSVPPPSIDKVIQIYGGIHARNEAEADFGNVLRNAQQLIQQQR